MTEAVVRRCFSKQVLLKMIFRPAILLKKDSKWVFSYEICKNTVKTAAKTLFLRKTSVAASGLILKPIIWWNFICLLILISFQFKLYRILINLVKVNNLIYCAQEKAPKIKRLIQCIKSYLFICLFSNNRN